jgi:hypothetical protein
MQRKAFQECEWGPDGVLPYAQRRDNTFGQLSSNILLIRLEKFVATLKTKPRSPSATAGEWRRHI